MEATEAKQTELFSFPFAAMGSECSVYLYDDRAARAEAVAELMQVEAWRIEAKYSRYREDSVLSEINRRARQRDSIDLDEETATLIDYAYVAFEKSDSLFDITSGLLRSVWNFSTAHVASEADIGTVVPRIGLDKLQWNRPRLSFSVAEMELDLGGLGKEYAVDRLAEIAHSEGIRHGLVDLGGDLRAIGPHPHGQPWSVRIRDPRALERAVAVVMVMDDSVATSGDYERYFELDSIRYCHILNPSTGRPAHGWRSVTVIAERCLVAGTLSTIAMLKGKEGIAWLQMLGLAHLWIDDSGQLGGSLAEL